MVQEVGHGKVMEFFLIKAHTNPDKGWVMQIMSSVGKEITFGGKGRSGGEGVIGGSYFVLFVIFELYE